MHTKKKESFCIFRNPTFCSSWHDKRSVQIQKKAFLFADSLPSNTETISTYEILLQNQWHFDYLTVKISPAQTCSVYEMRQRYELDAPITTKCA